MSEYKRIIDQMKIVIDEMGNLIGCYPPGSDQAKKIEDARGIMIDAVLDISIPGDSDNLAAELPKIAGDHARQRLKRAFGEKEKADVLADLLADSALIDELKRRAGG